MLKTTKRVKERIGVLLERRKGREGWMSRVLRIGKERKNE